VRGKSRRARSTAWPARSSSRRSARGPTSSGLARRRRCACPSAGDRALETMLEGSRLTHSTRAANRHVPRLPATTFCCASATPYYTPASRRCTRLRARYIHPTRPRRQDHLRRLQCAPAPRSNPRAPPQSLSLSVSNPTAAPDDDDDAAAAGCLVFGGTGAFAFFFGHVQPGSASSHATRSASSGLFFQNRPW
jgi:hypothetical protein